MSEIWKTKYGLRRVRHEPPTVVEAIAAARDLTEDIEQQIEIAASLMGLDVEAVRAVVAKTRPERKLPSTVAFTTRKGAQRAVVVERKVSRRAVSTGT